MAPRSPRRAARRPSQCGAGRAIAPLRPVIAEETPPTRPHGDPDPRSAEEPEGLREPAAVREPDDGCSRGPVRRRRRAGGLGDRPAFDRRLARAVVLARRERRPLAVVLLDVDHFRRLDERHGRAVGEQVLATVAALLDGFLGPGDAACSDGDDAFALLLAGVGRAAALDLAARLKDQIARLRFLHRGRRFSVTASFGLVAADVASAAAALSAGALVGAAREALYVAKHSGRDRICEARLRQRPPSPRAAEKG